MNECTLPLSAPKQAHNAANATTRPEKANGTAISTMLSTCAAITKRILSANPLGRKLIAAHLLASTLRPASSKKTAVFYAGIQKLRLTMKTTQNRLTSFGFAGPIMWRSLMALLCFGLPLSPNAFAQATTASTTLSAAISANTTTQWCVASATGTVLPSVAANGSYFAVDQEVVQISGAGTSSTCFKVKRGQLGTSANAAHASAAKVWVGAAAVSTGDPSRPFAGGAFITVAPSGACTSSAQYTLPLIATGGATGRATVDLVQCISSKWSRTVLGGQLTFVGNCTLGTSCAVTLPGIGFTASTSYQCAATDQTAAAAVKVVNTSATVATFTGTGTDVIGYICAGT